MTDPHFQSIQQYRDVESLNAYREMREAGIDEAEILTILGQNHGIIHVRRCNGMMKHMLVLQLERRGLKWQIITTR